MASINKITKLTNKLKGEWEKYKTSQQQAYDQAEEDFKEAQRQKMMAEENMETAEIEQQGAQRVLDKLNDIFEM